MKKLLTILILFSCTFFCQLIKAQTLFNTQTNFPIGGSPRGITTADINHDGKADVIIAHDTPGNNVRILLGNGAGGFTSTINVQIGYSSGGSLIADFNMDGNPDIATIGGDSSAISVALGNGSGNFSSFLSFPVTGGPDAATSADFNSDGKPDIAVADYSSATIAILLGNGLGSFGTPTYINSGLGSADIISKDFNNDNKIDIALIYDGISQVAIFLGDGQGGFSSQNSYSVAWYPLSLTSADFNEDGNLDIATANYYGDNVSVLLNNGNGTFATSTNFSALISSTNIVSADYNGDNHIDLAVTKNDNNDSLAILLGIGNGYFCKPIKYAIGSFSQSLAQADFNSDGKMDIATDIWLNSTLALFINKSTNPILTGVLGDSILCIGQSTTLSANSQNTTYYWTGPSPDTNVISNSPSVFINQPGVYTLHNSISCIDNTNFSVKIDSVKASFTANPTTGNAPANINFISNSQSFYSSIKNYTWNFGNGNNNTTTAPITSTTYYSYGIFPVKLIVTDNYGCSDSITHNITIIEFPNVFTPNGDNINDIFNFKNPGLTSVDCIIYDRWGLQIYQWTDINGGWDGKNKNGISCNDGTYFYSLTYTDLSGKTQTKNSFIQLLR